MPGITRKLFSLAFAVSLAVSSHAAAGDALRLPKADLVSATDLAAQLKGPVAKKTVLIQVGFKMLYLQAHIPESIYTGAANSPEGLGQLATRLKGLSKSARLVIYCGCCPWDKCPNVAAAYKKAKALGFKQVKVLHIPSDFGTDWVAKGYPTAEGE